ncbi:MAG: hypothetical protein QOF84_4356 [Streptomyces sp.]|nr:hypothetical protein [Streptomyces sp.]
MTPEARIDALERDFGPLDDPDNPLGADRLIAADTRGEVLAEGEAVLDAHAMNTEFVPESLGGRLNRMDVLGRVLRPMFRRDASLGFGYGLNCFFAAAPVWSGGDPAQLRLTAAHLLEGRRIAVARHEVAHGNDFVRDEFEAEPLPGGGYLLNGRKTAIANAHRADGLVVFVRTGDAVAGRSHSVLLLDRRELPEDALRNLARHSTTGMRGGEFGGLEAQDCPVPADALIGEQGDGYRLSLRSSLLIRGLIPSIVLAGADTALRTVVRFAVRTRDDGRSSLDVAHVKNVLTGAFLDLLLSDCLALVATRALHLLPRQVSVYAAVAAYVVPKITAEAMDELSAVLGEAQFGGAGAYGMFAKQVRDLPVTSLGHAGSAGRQVSILPQLPLFARKSWFSDDEPPATLFRPYDALPPLDLDSPALLADSDPLSATLTGTAHAEGTALGELTRLLSDELGELRKAFVEIDPADRKALVSPFSFGLADRYALVLAAAACLGVWREQREAATDQDPFLADDAWPTAVLYRLCRRLGLPLPDRPTGCEQRVLAEVLARLHGRRSYDLYGSPLA